LDGFDSRTTLARDDVAEQALEGVVRAQRFRATTSMQCTVYATGMRRAADPQAEQIDRILFGEVIEVLEVQDGWAFARTRRDTYVGWVELSAFADGVLLPTHRVSALRTYALSEPSLMAPEPSLLNLNSLVTVEGASADGRFLKVARAGWVAAVHLADLIDFETDPVAVAARHLGAPYQWGGRESIGVDCSGLVQQALFACGRACPRDADQQEAALGADIARDDLRRGDLIFWQGHVAWALDADRVLHANGHQMMVGVEALADVVERFRASGAGEPTSYRRL
jgi:hypothetical protein